MLRKLPLVFSSMIVAIILFQSALIAPAINELLNESDTAVLLRFIWPKFFILLAILATAAFISLLKLKSTGTRSKYIMLATVIIMLASYFVTPIINEAKDSGKDQLWSVLHIATVAGTFAVLLINLWNLRLRTKG